jgi:hypothetical protein
LTTFLLYLSLVITASLCIANAVFAVIFRKRRVAEILSYIAASLVELIFFVFVLLLRLGILAHIPYHLPSNLPFTRTQIGVAVALGIGLFPAAYWHRTSVSQVRERMSHDAQVLKERESGVHVHSNAPGEWLN